MKLIISYIYLIFKKYNAVINLKNLVEYNYKGRPHTTPMWWDSNHYHVLCDDIITFVDIHVLLPVSKKEFSVVSVNLCWKISAEDLPVS